MNTERAERLFSAIGGVSDALVSEAAQPGEPREKKPSWVRWGALAAALALVAGTAWSFPRMGGYAGGTGVNSGADAAPGEITFMSYGGPALPLTVVEGPEGLPATREVTWDFASTLGEKGSGLYTVTVTDAASIRNDGGEDLTLTVGYPVTASLGDGEDRLPTLSVNGERLETALLWGNGGLETGEDPYRWSPRLESWADVKAVLEDGSCLEEAMEAVPALEATVTVWELTGSAAPDTDKGAPTLGVSFRIDEERTQVFTWGFNGGEWGEDGWRRYSYFVPRTGEPDGRRLLIFLGEAPEEYVMAGYEDGGCDRPLEGVSARVSAFTTSLGELMDRLVEEWDAPGRLADVKAAVRRMMAKLLPGDGGQGPFTMLEELISETLFSTRVVWTTAEVTIPAGGTVTVTARYQKEPSYDFACARRENQGLYGFDLGTRLGSTLEFTGITARLENARRVELVGDSFGFREKAGGWEAAFTPETERYTMVIRLRPEG